jgi:hypothetical protein
VNPAVSKTKPDIKLFQKWSFNGIEAKDPGLKRYLNLSASEKHA